MAGSVKCNGCEISIINEKGLKDIFDSLKSGDKLRKLENWNEDIPPVPVRLKTLDVRLAPYSITTFVVGAGL